MKFILPTDVVLADKFAADANTKVVSVDAIPDGWMGLDNGVRALVHIHVCAHTHTHSRAHSIMFVCVCACVHYNMYRPGVNEDDPAGALRLQDHHLERYVPLWICIFI